MTLGKIEKTLQRTVEKLGKKYDKLVEKQFEFENNFDDYEEKKGYQNNIEKQFEVADELEEAKEELRVIINPKSIQDIKDGEEIIKCETSFNQDVIKAYENRNKMNLYKTIVDNDLLSLKYKASIGTPEMSDLSEDDFRFALDWQSNPTNCNSNDELFKEPSDKDRKSAMRELNKSQSLNLT